MDLPLTAGTYSADNYDASLCAGPDGETCWVAWAAYGPKGSRSFARRFDGRDLHAALPLSPSDRMQARPLCVPDGPEARLVWLEKEAQTYSVWERGTDGNDLGKPERLITLPASAKPWEMQAVCGHDGALWVCWAESRRAWSEIRGLSRTAGGKPEPFAVGIGRYNYRPRIAACEGDRVYLVWDSYVEGSYHVYGCALSGRGPADTVRISRGLEWENRSALCRDREGRLWAAWVRWKDVIYRDSALQQQFDIRGARFDGASWEPVSGPDGGPDITPLHYGLLTDFPKPPNLGHMGRRLHPVLKAREGGGVWLFWEAKADEGQGTLASTGRLIGRRCGGGTWSEPFSITEGRVYYELPHNGTVGGSAFLVSKDTVTDERHLETVSLSDGLPIVPPERRSVDLGNWPEVRLPFPSRLDGQDRPRNELRGPDSGRYQLFWADLHCHSSASIEVEGEPDELGHFARDKARIHGLTVSDNDNFWNRFVRQHVRHLTDYEWDCVKGNAMVLDEPDVFAMFPGYEMTITDRVDSGRDHRSVMSDDDEMEMDLLHWKHWEDYCAGRRDTQKDVKECIAWLKEKGYLALPHPHHGKWNVHDLDVEWGVDVCAAWMISFDLFDIYFRHLDAGHRFAFTGSGDSHHRNPGLSGALTGIWAERLDRESLLQAIRDRRTFATAGQKILVEFTIDDRMMGSVLSVDGDPVLRWRVIGEDQDYILRIHRDGRLMHEERFVGESYGVLEEFMLKRYRPGSHYYYLEVLSPDPIPQYPANVAHALGAKAWSTPIWVETREQPARRAHDSEGV